MAARAALTLISVLSLTGILASCALTGPRLVAVGSPSESPIESPSGSIAPGPPIDEPVVESVLPLELLGLWVSIDQGSAETIYRFVGDGTYDQVSMLLQQRASGIFSFTTEATGIVEIDGDRMILTPTFGNETMEDPDSPSSNFDRPLDDFTPEEYFWAVEGGILFLTGQYGTVAYEPTTEE